MTSNEERNQKLVFDFSQELRERSVEDFGKSVFSFFNAVDVLPIFDSDTQNLLTAIPHTEILNSKPADFEKIYQKLIRIRKAELSSAPTQIKPKEESK